MPTGAPRSAARFGAGVPVLGICLGMQWLFEGSDESPDLAGLGAFRRALPRDATGAVKVPHVGWNTLELTGRPSRLLDRLARGSVAYFTHTFAAPGAKTRSRRPLTASGFTSVVERDGVARRQFHPEKSAETGLEMLANFLAIAR